MKNNSSANTRRAADENAAIKTEAQRLLEMCQDREAHRVASPEWTAVIVLQDDKTEVIQWRRTDELNEKLF